MATRATARHSVDARASCASSRRASRHASARRTAQGGSCSARSATGTTEAATSAPSTLVDQRARAASRPPSGPPMSTHALCTTYHADRSEEHTSELQSQFHLVCRLLLEKKKKNTKPNNTKRTPTHK